MKKILLLISALGLAATPCFATLPTYKSTSASGTTAATAYFPADPNSQVRVVSYNSTSDKAASVMTFTSGTTAYVITATNAAATSVTNQINTTNGLTGSAALVLQLNGTNYSATVSSFNIATNVSPAQTNVVLGANGWNVNTIVGGDVYLMSTAVTIPNGAATVSQNGDAVFVGNYGRPVKVVLDGTSSCAINVISAHYDNASQ